MSYKKSRFWLSVVIVTLLAALLNVGLAHADMLRVNSLADSLADDGACTLREAIINANEDAATWPDCRAGQGADVIYLDDLSGTILLTSDLPSITDPDGLVLHGPAVQYQLTIDGDNQYRILNVQAGPMTVRNLTLTGANSSSYGSVLSAPHGSTIEIWDSFVTNSSNSAIAIEGGSLTVVGSSFESNSGSFGAGIWATNNPSASQAAPVLLIDNSTFVGNLVSESGHAIYQYTGSLTINNSMLWSNGASNQGRGVVGYAGNTDITVTGCQFLSNHGWQGVALHDGGGSGTLRVENSIFSDNHASYRGGVIHSGGSMAIDIYHSTFRDNSADAEGGAICSYAPITIDRSTFTNNISGQTGGAIFTYSDGGTITITNSLFQNNSANFGGAIFYGRGLYVTNSTFYLNTAGVGGGALGSFTGWGEITNSTFDHNAALQGATLYFSSNSDPNLVLRNNIFANPSMSANCFSYNGTYPDGGSNLQYPDASCNVSIPVLDPLLDLNGPQDNGGPTWTIALQAGSPAIDRVPVAAIFPLTDQRGAPRPVNGDGSGDAQADSGAFEYAGVVPIPTPVHTPTPTPSLTPTPRPNFPMTLVKTAEDVNGGNLNPGDVVRYVVTITNDSIPTHTNIVLTDLLPAGVTFQSATPAADSGPNPLVWHVGTLAPGGVWSVTILVTVNADADVIGGNMATLVSDQMQEATVGPILPPGGGLVTPFTDLQATIAIEELLYDVTYTVVFRNAGPEPVEDASVTAIFPTTMNVTWSCTGQGGGVCPAPSGTGNVTGLSDLPVNGSVTYIAHGMLRNQLSIVNADAIIAPPSNVDDSNLANNTAVIRRYRVLMPVLSK